MQFGVFDFMRYSGSGRLSGAPLAPKHFEPERSLASTQANFELLERAEELGFDWVTVSEHHYSTSMTPNPIVAAAAVSQRVKRARIAVFGPTLPLLNPVRVAEELAMLDNLSGGRIMAGFLRGTPPEYLTYGTNPAESRALFEEGVELILKAWSEPEPFGWEGVHYRFRTIAVWPRPLQQPYPPIMVSGNSRASLSFAARHRFNIGFSFPNPSAAGANFERYRAEAAAQGWTPTAENAFYRQNIYLAESDEQAWEAVREYGIGLGAGNWRQSSAGVSAPSPAAAMMRDIAGRVGTGGPSSATDHLTPPFAGSPDSVVRQLEAAAAASGASGFDLIFKPGHLPMELAVRSLNLFGREILPVLQRSPAEQPGDRVQAAATAGC
jgi:alkanesulfonate monooxygenase SsuD/methylene tetrahydromethanopterin reductase-like flavin-dependent oxidoreductase (luciferase family)